MLEIKKLSAHLGNIRHLSGPSVSLVHESIYGSTGARIIYSSSTKGFVDMVTWL